VVAGEQS
jgi:tetratricopeptide (TPR) repeat protein